jgi:hypothetical protein
MARHTAAVDESKFLMIFFMIDPSFESLGIAFSCGRNQERPSSLRATGRTGLQKFLQGYEPAGGTRALTKPQNDSSTGS